MTDYKKLVEALRDCASGDGERCLKCTYHKASNMPCDNALMTDAAAAIEALQAELDKYHELCDVDEIPEVLEILMTRITRRYNMNRDNVYKLCERIKEKGNGYYISEVMLSKDAVDAIIDCAVCEAVEAMKSMGYISGLLSEAKE